MGLLRKRPVKPGGIGSLANAKSSLCIDEDEVDMRRDIEEQRQAAAALQTYVEEVVAGFEKLLLAQEKLREGAMTELREVEQAMEAPLSSLGRAVRHVQSVASQTTVGLQVHQQKLSACCEELARTAKVAAMLQSKGVASQGDMYSDDRDVDSKVSATTSKGSRWQKTQMEGEPLGKLIHAAKVQQAYARSTLEACVGRRECLVELARKSLEAVAKTVPQVDETIVMSVLDVTACSISSGSTHAPDSTCGEPWNPFGPDLMQGQSTDDSMPLTSKSSEEACATNPFSARLASTTSESWEPWSKNHESEECLNNPFTEDLARVDDDIPNRDAVVQTVGPCRWAQLIVHKNDGSSRLSSGFFTL
jgi:hypothetical protein